jgi:hypothetical protein
VLADGGSIFIFILSLFLDTYLYFEGIKDDPIRTRQEDMVSCFPTPMLQAPYVQKYQICC